MEHMVHQDGWFATNYSLSEPGLCVCVCDLCGVLRKRDINSRKIRINPLATFAVLCINMRNDSL